VKYFFVLDKSDKRYIVVAENIDKAAKVIEKAGIKWADIYELKEDTFKEEGILISDK